MKTTPASPSKEYSRGYVITFSRAGVSIRYMNYDAMVNREATAWAEAVNLMQATLDAKAGKIGLRRSEAAEALSIATSKLLENDAAALRTARAQDSKAFICAVILNTAKNIVRDRQTRHSKEITLDHAAMHHLLEFAPV